MTHRGHGVIAVGPDNPAGADRDWTEASAEFLAAIVTASDDAIASKSLDGTILSWNAAAERLFGYTAAEAIGQSIDLIIPDHLRDEERSILERLRRGECIDHFETVRVAKDGRRVEISLTVSPVRNKAGQVIAASKVARDITDRKRTEQALRASEERFRELANNIDQFAWTCDELGYATWYNERWYEYTGTTLASMQGSGWKAVHHPDHVERVEASLMHSVRAEEPWEEIFPLRGKDGQYRWFLSRAIPIRNAAGQVIRWFGTNTDITVQRELELALRDADRRKDEFLATLSHELRNPLAPITNSLEVLRQTDDDAAFRRQALDAIGRQVSHLVRLVDDLLDVSRITHDRLELRKSRVELGSMIHQAAEAWRPLTVNDGQTIEYALPAEPVHLDADPVRLSQILNNLLNNACKFSAKGGVIRVAAERQGNHVIVTIRDYGVGIPADKLDSIFDMFAQVHCTGGELTGGLGIGLTLVKRLVELHGGSISARSEGPQQGSEFIMRLPISQEAHARRDVQHAGPDSDRERSLRILVVDDNVDNADSLSMLLKVNGHQTLVAYDGPTAVRVAEEQRPDALLLDLGLPKLDGIEVCRRLRRETWGRDMRIIAVTGWGQEDDRRKSTEAGFDEHLIKPIEYAELKRVLAREESKA